MRLFARLGPAHPASGQAERDVVERAEMPEQDLVLEYDANATLFGRDEDASRRVVEDPAGEADAAAFER